MHQPGPVRFGPQRAILRAEVLEIPKRLGTSCPPIHQHRSARGRCAQQTRSPHGGGDGPACAQRHPVEMPARLEGCQAAAARQR
eukprot:scaffold22390_cov28-Tisochrysis_lutea.AAC.8